MSSQLSRRFMQGVSVAAVVAILGFGIIACEKQPEGTVVATYKGGKVTVEQIDNKLNELVPLSEEEKKKSGSRFSSLQPDLQEGIIRDMIAEQLIKKAAADAGLEKRNDIKQKVDQYRNQLVQQEFLKEKVAGTTDEAKLKAKYDQLVKDMKGKEETRARHILVATKKEAEALYTKVTQDKVDFAALAKELTLDHASAKNGGDVGYFMEGQMVPEFEAQAKKLKKGETSEPFQTQFGWHIMQVLDRRPAQPAPYEQVKDTLKQQVEQESVNAYITSLLSSADVAVKLSNLQTLKKPNGTAANGAAGANKAADSAKDKDQSTGTAATTQQSSPAADNNASGKAESKDSKTENGNSQSSDQDKPKEVNENSVKSDKKS